MVRKKICFSFAHEFTLHFSLIKIFCVCVCVLCVCVCIYPLQRREVVMLVRVLDGIYLLLLFSNTSQAENLISLLLKKGKHLKFAYWVVCIFIVFMQIFPPYLLCLLSVILEFQIQCADVLIVSCKEKSLL